MRFAVIVANVVANIVEWDGVSSWTPPAGSTAVQTALADIGWTWNNGVPVNPNPPPAVGAAPDLALLSNQGTAIRATILAIAALTNLTVPQVTVAFAAAYRQLNGS